MSTETVTCKECGMFVHDEGEYHPFAACLMFRACNDRATVLANLNAVLKAGYDSGYTDASDLHHDRR